MIRTEEGAVELTNLECRLLARRLIVRICAEWRPDWEDLPSLNQSSVDRVAHEVHRLGEDLAGALAVAERCHSIDTLDLYEATQ